MARYSIKMLKDENGNPFVPLVNTEGIKNNDGENLDSILSRKLETSNIKAGSNITIDENNGNITINSTGGGGGSSTVLIDNLTTSEPNQGALDARQGKVLKDSIPQVINNLTTVDTNKALSAYQGYLLDHKFNDYLPLNKLANNLTTSADEVGQYALDAYQGKVLSEKINTVEDNQIISSDKSVNDIITLTKEEYKQLVDDGSISETTYYNILDDVIPASTSVPVGTIMIWPASLDELPSNMMQAAGQELKISDYPTLFARYGTTYGGDGITTFNLPDYSGLTVVGLSSSDSDFDTLGAIVGSKQHNHTPGETLTACIGSPTGNANALGFAAMGASGPDSTYSVGNSASYTTNGHPKRSHNTRITGYTNNSSTVQPSAVAYYVVKVKEDAHTEDMINLDSKVADLEEQVYYNLEDEAETPTGRKVYGKPEYIKRFHFTGLNSQGAATYTKSLGFALSSILPTNLDGLTLSNALNYFRFSSSDSDAAKCRVSLTDSNDSVTLYTYNQNLSEAWVDVCYIYKENGGIHI